METLLTIGLGLGLAAACGFRIFVPLLVMSIGGRTGHLELGSGFEWIGTDPALVALGVATVLEIGAYYIPWLDNMLDAVAGPAAVVAGIVVSASAVSDMSPLLQWSLAVVGGGGVAATVQAATTAARGLSSLTTFGFGNPIVATFEAGGALLMSLAAVLVPLVAGVTVVVSIVILATWLVTRKPRAQAAT